jgi:D-alanyl-D-alanine carboxypeptidase
MMNETAKKIGMKDSFFVNPSGLEERDGSANKSTVYDMALLTRYAMNNKDYKRIVSTKEIIVKSSLKTYKWVNKNKLLSSYKYCTGGKTGFTKKAHRTLVTTASNGNMNLIVVTFNDGNDFDDHKSLYEKYFNNYERVKIIDKNTDYGKNLKLKNDFFMIKKDGDEVELNVIKYDISNALNGSVGGKVEVILNGNVLGSRNLYYEKISVSKDKSFLSKLLDFLKFW